MNFMSGNPGFYEEMRAMSSSSSSSSSLHHRGGPQLPESSPANNNNDDNDDLLLLGHAGGGSNSTTPLVEREHMFDKVVTPSDVGKLNRLVIPKQHAEKYFPLDSSTNEKGLLLNFEDRNGKPWRFRYSYWNSSQSYVMTKGWSRFVKEKKLDAGDIVSFQRGVGELGKDRLFIDWRRRPDAPDHHFPPPHMLSSIPHHHFSSYQRSSYAQPWNPLYLQQASHLLQNTTNYHHHHNQHHQYHPYGGPNYSYSTVVNGNPCPPGSIVYLRSAAAPQGGGGVLSGGAQEQVGMVHSTSGVEQMVFDSVPVVQGKAAAKRLRLFGVNMDCPISESDECDILSSSTTLPHQTIPFHHLPSSSSSPNSSLQLRPYINEEKGKGSMSLDLDI